MNVIVSEKVKRYMEEKEFSHILVEPITQSSWCGSYTDLVARFAQKREIEKYLESGFKTLSDEFDYILIPKSNVGMSETVRFELSQFLWKSEISMNGMWMD